jgi:hypothetical protein
VLLAKTLTSSTFKLALIAIATFGVIVSALFSYVYLSTSSYVRGRSDRAIMTEYFSLQAAYEQSGRDGLIALIGQRIADKSVAGNAYILADPSLARLAGNLKAWPSTVTAARGWTEFRASESLPGATNPPLLRAMLETFPGGDRLLVGRDISELDSFTDQIKTAVISVGALLVVLAVLASILLTRSTVGRI